MASLKATFEGIGTGGGVAWPLFGILFPTLGLAVGGALTVIIGSTIGVLFLAVCLPVFYLSYKNSSKEEKALRAKLSNDRKLFNEEISNYLQSIFKEYLHPYMASDDVEYEMLLGHMRSKLVEDMERTNSAFLKKLFARMLADQGLLTGFVNDKISGKDTTLTIKQFTSRCAVSPKPTPRSLLASAAFIGFVSTFGATAGTSSGILGLLTGMSVFAGLAAFPILGWGILSVAVVLSFIVAGSFIYIANEKFQRRLQHSILKEGHHQLASITLERNKTITLQQTSQKMIDAIERADSLENNGENKEQLKALIPQFLSEFSDSFFKNSEASIDVVFNTPSGNRPLL